VSHLAIDRATPDDGPPMLALLAASGLPTAGLMEHLVSAYVAKRDGRIVGTAALELYEGGALLRSVAVDEGERGGGLGRLLTERAIGEALPQGVAVGRRAEGWRDDVARALHRIGLVVPLLGEHQVMRARLG